MSKPISPSFASLVQEFFTDYMTRQRSLTQPANRRLLP
jgi:hypothetical protein